LHIHMCSGHNRVVPLMQRPNTWLWPEQVWTCNITLHIHMCSGRNRVIPLMRRPNTDGMLNKPVTLPHNQLLIRYTVMSPVHIVTMWRYDTR